MPNFRAKNIDLSLLPFRGKDCYFAWASDWAKGTALVFCTLANGEKTLLQISKRDGFFVAKVEKMAKLSNLASMQKALIEFKNACASDIIDEACAYKPTQNLEQNILNAPEQIRHLAEQNQLFIEIGFGSGRHLLARAQDDLSAVFIGIEIHRPSLLQASRLAHAKGIKNVYFLDADARMALGCQVQNSIAGIYVHFPVPWPNSPSRRVISHEFAALCAQILRPGGFVQLRTDEEFYHKYAQECFSQNIWQQRSQINQAGFALSKYEARWQRQGKDIYDLFAFKTPLTQLAATPQNREGVKSSDNTPKSPAKPLAPQNREGAKSDEPFAPILTPCAKECFIKTTSHFAKISKLFSTPAGTLALAHFGAFATPCSAYLLFSEHGGDFLLSQPAASADNLLGWELLRAQLCSRR